MFPKNGGTPKSSIFMGFSIINHLFWGTPIFGNTHIKQPGFHGKLVVPPDFFVLMWLQCCLETFRFLARAAVSEYYQGHGEIGYVDYPQLAKPQKNGKIIQHVITHRIHVRYIYLHLVDFYGKCS